jgi:prevent-host-death family protein
MAGKEHAMITVTFSDLRNHARKYFDAVEHGETIEVYRKGKPVARLTPVRTPDRVYWRQVKPVVLDGVSLSQAVLEEREESL